MKFLVLLLAFASFAHATTLNKWKGDVDALDLWELAPNTDVKAAIEAFKTKCAEEIPSRTNANLIKVQVEPTDFFLKTKVTKRDFPRFGISYLCTLEAKANENVPYVFSTPIESERFFDIRDPETRQITVTAIDQCKTYIKALEERAVELKLFSRNALLEWVKRPNDRKLVEACFVKYTRLTPPQDQN